MNKNNIDILKIAYSNLRNVYINCAIPTFSWFCELVTDKNHFLYKNYVDPIYKKQNRIKKLKRLM